MKVAADNPYRERLSIYSSENPRVVVPRAVLCIEQTGKDHFPCLI